MSLVVLLYIAIVVAVCAAALPKQGDWIGAAALLVAAPVVWILGRRANGAPTAEGIARIFDDSILSMAGRPGARQSARPQSLMFIRLEYWSVFVAACGLAMLLVRPCSRGLFG